jgi:hypothetical protein
MRILILLLAALPALAVTPVQSKSCGKDEGSNVNPHTCTFTSPVTAGNLIVGFIRATGCTGNTTPVTWSDSKSNGTWQEDGNAIMSALTTRGISIGSGVATTGGSSFQVSTSTATACRYIVMIISEYSGMATTSWRDGSSVMFTSGATTTSTGGCGTITTTNANDVVVTGVGVAATTDLTYTVPTGFQSDADREDTLGSAFHAGATSDDVLTSTGSLTPVWGWGTSYSYSAGCVAYKKAPTAGARRRVMVIQ